ncbi:MAG: hypothetical protein J5654_09670 [Victivallales bacterium]|nr:hypothetical protein [Victivallales bacterium]
MTDAEILTAVNAIFDTHLDGEYWAGLENTRKTAAVKTATLDILARVAWLSQEDIAANSPALYAIAEQAVYLSRNYADQTSGKVITSESVEGLSVGYTLVGGTSKWGIGLSPRAEAYLNQLSKSRFKGGIYLTRG